MISLLSVITLLRPCHPVCQAWPKINRAKHAFDKDLLVTIIKGLVFSKMFYFSSVWSNTSVTNINKLQAIQNFAARTVTRPRTFDRITPILKQLCWMPVKDYLFYRDDLLVFKCMNVMAPSNLSSTFIKRGTISGRSTRNANLLDIPRYKNRYGPAKLFVPRSNHLEQLT